MYFVSLHYVILFAQLAGFDLTPAEILTEHMYSKDEIMAIAQVVNGERASLLGVQRELAGLAVAQTLLNDPACNHEGIRAVAEARFNGYDPDISPLDWEIAVAEVAATLSYNRHDFTNGALFVFSYHDLKTHNALHTRPNATLAFQQGEYGLYTYQLKDYPLPRGTE